MLLFFSDIVLPVILLSSGIFLTVKFRFVQVRFLKQGLKNMLSGYRENSEGISPFAALATSLAAQLGTGNIVGAGSAIIAGGPGAVFWMWVSAFFGMAIAYEEAFASVLTRKRNENGGFSGGAAYYISYAFGGKAGRLLSGAFSLFSLIALGFTGVAVQANSVSTAIKEAFSVPLWVTAVIITALAAFVIKRGDKSIASFAEKTIPPLALLYIAGCMGVIIINIKNLPCALKLIFAGAFSPAALFGGITGIGIREAVTQGIKRGLFTNEAGMGSTPSAHALSNSTDPHFQGTLGMTGVFIDTFVMLSVTALAVICVLYTGNEPPASSISGSSAVASALATLLSEKGAEIFIALSVLFFAFASIIGWSLFGKVSALYLFGKESEKIYIPSSLLFVFLGCILSGGLVWTVTDFFNTLMVLTNIPALLKLSVKISEFIPKRRKTVRCNTAKRG